MRTTFTACFRNSSPTTLTAFEGSLDAVSVHEARAGRSPSRTEVGSRTGKQYSKEAEIGVGGSSDNSAY
jgi:hypothetical protein